MPLLIPPGSRCSQPIYIHVPPPAQAQGAPGSNCHAPAPQGPGGLVQPAAACHFPAQYQANPTHALRALFAISAHAQPDAFASAPDVLTKS